MLTVKHPKIKPSKGSHSGSELSTSLSFYGGTFFPNLDKDLLPFFPNFHGVYRQIGIIAGQAISWMGGRSILKIMVRGSWWGGSPLNKVRDREGVCTQKIFRLVPIKTIFYGVLWQKVDHFWCWKGIKVFLKILKLDSARSWIFFFFFCCFILLNNIYLIN